MPVTPITSDSEINIEQHFRVSAGPGAGKTHWLIGHIKKVLQSSQRMGCNKKIACITYTNVGVETLVRRLDFVADRVEVSTIHSFLYYNIIKPYVSFIAAEFELNVHQLDGHEEHVMSRSRIVNWLSSHPNQDRFSHPYTLNQMTGLSHNIMAIGNWLLSLKYVFSGNALSLVADNSEAYYMNGDRRQMLGKTTCLDKLAPGFMHYKKIFWRNGVLHHDDVLYFSYILLTRFPFIISVLRCKFPYFYIDEFQDTSPIQSAILNLIGRDVTIVGIIGDKAQSIYSFQGAMPQHFDKFNLPSLMDYVISDNRRSSNEIVKVLDHIRTDIKQIALRNVPGDRPILFVGEMKAALNEAARLVSGEELTSLSRDNVTANAIKMHLDAAIPNRNLLKELHVKDSNPDRRRIIVHCINAIELARQNRFKEAIKEMEKNHFHIRDKIALKKTAFTHLLLLLSKYDHYKTAPLTEFHRLLKQFVKTDISNLINKGEALPFYAAHTYEQIAVCIRIEDENSSSRTIHKAKGDEFENVIIVMNKKNHLGFLTAPNLNNEEHRIFYVGVSRAKKRLFMTIPELDANDESKLQALIEIRRMGI